MCVHVHHDKQSRNYGERVYLEFRLFDCEFEGKRVRMFLRPSKFPTSNFYRSWAIARGGPPSRNTKMSARIFSGKLFRVLTATVRPRHRIAGADGKLRNGPFLPESFWYSKVACILELIATNEAIQPTSTLNTNEGGGLRPPTPPVFITSFPPNPFPERKLSEGQVGRRELGVGSKRTETEFAVRDGNQRSTPQPAGEEEKFSSPVPSPPPFGAPRSPEECKRVLRERGLL
jgi:hypothetical protein